MAEKLSGHGQPRSPRCRWSFDMRMVLHLLQELDYSLSERTKIFNRLFAASLLQHGFPSGLNARSISAQYADQKYKPRIWKDIIRPAKPDEAPTRNLLRQQIQRCARALGLDPKDRSPEPAQLIVRRRGRPAKGQQIPARTKVTKRRAVIEIDRPSNTTVALHTPSAPEKRLSPRKQQAIMPFSQLDGKVILLTPEELAGTKEDPQPIPESVAYPTCGQSLLFRYTDNNSISPFGDNGFRAGRFPIASFRPPVQPDITQEGAFPWEDAFHHIEHDAMPSSFISSSNSLCWVLRLAIKKAKCAANNLDGRISVIDPSRLRNRPIYSHPVAAELKKKFLFTKGAWRYCGLHEFLIWAEIPAEAILCTITVDDLFGFAASPSVATLLRLGQIGVNRTGYGTKVLPALREQKVGLTPEVISTIADISRFFGVHWNSSTDKLSHIVCDIVQGWGLFVQYQNADDWNFKAQVYANAMISHLAGPIALKDNERLKFAFLDGIRWSTADLGMREKPEKIHVVASRAQKIGLESPGTIICHALDAAKLHIMVYEKQQQRLLQRAPASQRLLADADQDEDQIVEDDAEHLAMEDGAENEDIVIIDEPAAGYRVVALEDDPDGDFILYDDE